MATISTVSEPSSRPLNFSRISKDTGTVGSNPVVSMSPGGSVWLTLQRSTSARSETTAVLTEPSRPSKTRTNPAGASVVLPSCSASRTSESSVRNRISDLRPYQRETICYTVSSRDSWRLDRRRRSPERLVSPVIHSPSRPSGSTAKKTTIRRMRARNDKAFFTGTDSLKHLLLGVGQGDQPVRAFRSTGPIVAGTPPGSRPCETCAPPWP